MSALAVDLFCGLGGWTEGLLAEGYDVVGFDIDRHVYGDHCYPAQLVIQDVLTLHGSQFRDAALIVASPPCQAYSWRAMPWKKAKAAPPPDNSLFDACFRIQREACDAAGRHVPMVVENVRGAQKWVGRARWNFGSFYLWGDVPALMPPTVRAIKVGGLDWKHPDDPRHRKGQSFNGVADAMVHGRKNAGGSWFAVAHNTTSGKGRNQDGRKMPGGGAAGWFGDYAAMKDGVKQGGDWSNDPRSISRISSSKSRTRKFASAMIAKIPTPLSRWIAATYYPRATTGVAA